MEKENGMRVDLPFDPETMDIVCQREGDKMDRILHVNISQVYDDHSPDGFEWGYSGSGPANFALNILALFVGVKRARRAGFYQDFKAHFVATLPRAGGTIKGDAIRAWIAANERPQGECLEDIWDQAV